MMVLLEIQVHQEKLVTKDHQVQMEEGWGEQEQILVALKAQILVILSQVEQRASQVNRDPEDCLA